MLRTGCRVTTAGYGTRVSSDAPLSSPQELRAAVRVARDAAVRTLRSRPATAVLEPLAQVVENWLRTDYPLRQRAERELPALTGFSSQTVRHGLPQLLAPLRGDGVRRLLDAEFGDARVLDEPYRGRRAVGPFLIAHVLSGNIAGLAAIPLVLSLAIKSAVLLKMAAGDPLFARLFATSIAEVDADLGQCVCVARWPGGAVPLEEAVFAEADLVVASGSDATINALRGRVPCRFLGHGQKVSLAMVGRECLATEEAARALARRLAYDVSLWDQQGCLSPQICYVEAGAAIGPTQFAELVAAAMEHWAEALPPRQLTFAEQMEMRRFCQEAEWSVAGASRLLADKASRWAISLEDVPQFRPTCLNRCLRLQIVAHLDEVASGLALQRRCLEAAGVAVGPARRAAVERWLAACGVHRVCPIGQMQLPPLTWQQGGRPRVADWVDWVGIET
jgi:hypothetical protein